MLELIVSFGPTLVMGVCQANVCEDTTNPGRYKLIDLDSAIVCGEQADGLLYPELYRPPEVLFS